MAILFYYKYKKTKVRDMKDIFYYDISKKGKDILGTKDAPILTNEQAVKESLYNLLSTEIGSKVMDVTCGLNLDKYLFAPIDDYTSEMMAFDIREGILSSDEDRISELDVIVTPSADENTYDISINFSVVFSSTTETLQVTFNKIR